MSEAEKLARVIEARDCGPFEIEEDGDAETQASGTPTGSAGWVLLAEGISGTCVVLDFDPGCGAFAFAVDVCGGDNAEDLGLTDSPGEPGVFLAWLGGDCMDADGYITVDSFAEVGIGWRWLGLTPARCSHLFAPVAERIFPIARQKDYPERRCLMCGWHLERDLDLSALRALIEQRARAQ